MIAQGEQYQIVQNEQVDLSQPHAIINILDINNPQGQSKAIIQGIKKEDLEREFQSIYIGYDGLNIKLMKFTLPFQMIGARDLSWLVHEQYYSFRLLLHGCYMKNSEIVEFQTKFVEKLKLPTQVKLMLKDMIKEEKSIYIQDLGREVGTYVYLNKNEAQLIKCDQFYQVGDTAVFLIDQCHVVSYINEQNMTFFYQALSGLRYWNNNIIGLNSLDIEQQQTVAILSEFQLFAVLKQYNMPFIQIRFLPNHFYQQNYILFALNADQDSPIYTLGRGDDNDIQIFDEETSRIQCRVQYKGKEKNWYMYDGTLFEDSTNGTRLLLSTYTQNYNRIPSDIIKTREFKYFGLDNLVIHVEIKT